MTLVNLFEGETFAGKYKVLHCIATGGMGAVYEVVHINTNGHHALKVMKPEISNKEDLRERFKREAQVPAQIKSKHVVKVDDAGVDEKTQMLFLVMELLQGQDLGKRLKQATRFPFSVTVEYLRQTAKALDKAHAAHIVHRDLKPDNLFLCESDDEPPYIKVLDFGIAKFMAEQGVQANQTQALGTPLYMAPEQSVLGSAVSPATDIYALGMMAYTLLVGIPYWEDEREKSTHFAAFFMATMQGPQEAPTMRAARREVVLPQSFDSWFAQATSKAQDQRFRSASVAVKGLTTALGLPEPVNLGEQTAESTGMYVISSLTGQSVPSQIASGQTTPSPVSSGQTWPSRTGSESQTGTVVLDESTSTSGSGFGLSSSKPAMSTGATGLGQTRPSESLAMPAHSRSKGAIMAIALIACVVGIGAAMVLLKSTTARTNTAAVSPQPLAQAVEALIASVPTTTPQPIENAEPMVEFPKADPSKPANSNVLAPSSPPIPPTTPRVNPSIRPTGKTGLGAPCPPNCR